MTRLKIISHGQDHHGGSGQDRNSWLVDPQTSAACPRTSAGVQFSLKIGVLHSGAFRWTNPNGGQNASQIHSQTNQVECSVQAAHCFSMPGRATNATVVLLGSRASSASCSLKMQCGYKARAGIRDPWERYKIIRNQRGQSVKIGTITVSKDHDLRRIPQTRKLVQGVGTLTHAGDFAASGVSMYLGRPVRDQLRHVRNLLKPRSRATTDSLHNQRSDALEVSVGCPRNHTRRCRCTCR